MKSDHDGCSAEAVVAVREMLEKTSLKNGSEWVLGNRIWAFCAAHEDRGQSLLATQEMRVTTLTIDQAENLRKSR